MQLVTGAYRYVFSSFLVDLQQQNTFEGNNLLPGNESAGALLLPLSLKWDFWNIGRSSMFLLSGANLGLIFRSKDSEIVETGKLYDNNGDEIFSYTMLEDVRQPVFILPQIGLGYELPFLENGKLQFLTSYFIGLSTVNRATITYQLPPENINAHAMAGSRGTAFSLSVSVLYPIGK